MRLSSSYGQVGMLPRRCPIRKLLDGVPRCCSRHQLPLGGQQAGHSYRTPRVDLAGADSNLGAQTEPEAVGKARASVVEHTRAVHLRSREHEHKER